MRAKNFIFVALALLGMAVSCKENNVELEPAVKIISGASVEAEAAGKTHTVTFTSTTAWELQGIENYDWIAADAEAGKGSSEEQTIVLSISPNAEANRNASLTLYASPLAKKTITISQKGEKGDGITIAKFLELKDATNKYKLTGKIGDISKTQKYWGFMLKDETGEISCPFPSNWDDYKANLHTGDEVSITGTYKFFDEKKQDQVQNGEINTHTAADNSKIETITVAQILEKADKYTLYRFIGTVVGTVNTQFCSFDLTDASGKTIKVYTVNNSSEWGSKVKTGGTVTLTGAYTLYNNTTPELVDCTIEDFAESGGGETPVVKTSATGVVLAVSTRGFLFQTEANEIKYAFDSSNAPTVKVGDNVTVEGIETEYNGTPEFVDYTVTTNSTGNTVNYPTPAVLTSENIGSFTTMFGYVKVTGKLVKSGNFYNLNISGATVKGSISYPISVDDAFVDKKVDVTGYYVGISGKTTKYFNIVYTKMELAADQPVVETPGEGSITLTFPNDGGSSINGYDKTWTATVGGTEFSIANFNTYTNQWSYIKCGSKKGASVASIATAKAQATAFDKVVLTVDSYNASYVNSAKLYVASDSGFTTDLQTIDMVLKEDVGTFTIPTPAENRFYKVAFDCKQSTDNGPVQISKLVLWVNAK